MRYSGSGAIILPLAVVAAVLIMCGVVIAAANRFARRKEREGSWNADGPIHPTDPPSDWLRIPGYVEPRPTIETEPGTGPDPEPPPHAQ
jgi:hypothetical protein